MRLIDAKMYCMELYNEMNYPGRSEEFMTAIDVAIADLADAPTVDAVPVRHGRWIDAREYCGDYMCSNCEALYGTNKFNYCPNCGAKMDGERKEGANND